MGMRGGRKAGAAGKTNLQFLAGRVRADFYKYGFVGVMLDWIKDGMQEDYSTIVKKMSLTLHGNISNSIGNFLDEG